EGVGLGVDGGEEVLVGQSVLLQVPADPQDGVLGLPLVELCGDAVAGGVVVGGVGSHAVGEGFHERGAGAFAGGRGRGAGRGQAGQDVVAVDTRTGEGEAGCAPVDGGTGLAFQGFGDRPLVVLAEEDDRGVVDRGEVEGLVGVSLAGGAVTEVGDDGTAVLSDRAVALDAHRVAGGVQCLAADDDGVEVKAVFVGVPAAVGDAAEHAEQFVKSDVAAPGDAVFAVGGEGHVAFAECTAGADLCGFLPQEGGPQAQFSLALQRDRLAVDPAYQHRLSVQCANLFRPDVQGVVGVPRQFPFR